MELDQTQASAVNKEDVYWKIWQTEQEHMKVRWNNATFFISISFAILGFSFQSHMSFSATLAIRLSGIIIYWFSYILFLNFHRYTDLLRNHLRMMEISGDVPFKFQVKADVAIRSGKRSKYIESKWWLFYFGLLYTSGIILLAILGI